MNTNIYENDEYLFLKKIATYLIILIPVTLVTGPFFSDLSVVLIDIIFIYLIFKEKKLYYFKNIYFFFFLLFWVYINFNSILNYQNIDNLKISITYIRFGIFFLAIIYFLNFDSHLIFKKLFISFTLCFSFLIADSFYQYFMGENIFGMKTTNIRRISSVFRDDYILGSYLTRLYPIYFAICIFLFSKKFERIFSVSVIFVLSEVIIFLSGERTAFFFINLSAIFIIVFIDKFKKMRIVFLSVSLIIIMIITSINNKAFMRIVDQSVRDMGYSQTYDEKYIFSKRHDAHYKSALKMFKEEKFFGVGIKNFRYECKKIKYFVENGCSTHPHNTYIQFLAELGVMGFIFLISVKIFFLYIIYKHFCSLFRKEKFFNDFQICLLGSVLITLWPIAPTGNFFNNWLSIIYYFPIGFFIWSWEKDIKLYQKNSLQNKI